MISIPNIKEEQFQFVVQFLLDVCCIPHVDKAAVNEIYYEDVPVKAGATNNSNNTENKDKPEEKKDEKSEQTNKEKVKKERSNVCMLKISECTYGNPQSVLDVKLFVNL